MALNSPVPRDLMRAERHTNVAKRSKFQLELLNIKIWHTHDSYGDSSDTMMKFHDNSSLVMCTARCIESTRMQGTDVKARAPLRDIVLSEQNLKSVKRELLTAEERGNKKKKLNHIPDGTKDT